MCALSFIRNLVDDMGLCQSRRRIDAYRFVFMRYKLTTIPRVVVAVGGEVQRGWSSGKIRGRNQDISLPLLSSPCCGGGGCGKINDLLKYGGG